MVKATSPSPAWVEAMRAGWMARPRSASLKPWIQVPPRLTYQPSPSRIAMVQGEAQAMGRFQATEGVNSV
jgi:hypothetical protein